MSTKAEEKRQDQEDAREALRAMLQPGDRVATILRHVSSSGMSRRISAVICEDGEPRDITWLVARALGEPVKGRAGYVQDVGITRGGCGMDMGFDLIYSLSYALFGQGFECIGTGCPSNDHSNGDRDYSPHHHNSGGYALRQRWL